MIRALGRWDTCGGVRICFCAFLGAELFLDHLGFFCTYYIDTLFAHLTLMCCDALDGIFWPSLYCAPGGDVIVLCKDQTDSVYSRLDQRHTKIRGRCLKTPPHQKTSALSFTLILS